MFKYMNKKRDWRLETEESIEDLRFKLLESSIILKLRMNAYDKAIVECYNALGKIGQREKESDIYAHRKGMLLSNLAIAIAAKYETEEDLAQKEEYRCQAEKCFAESIKLWQKLDDDYNVFVVRLHKADFEFDCDRNTASWFSKYRRIAKKIKNDDGNLFQLLYSEMLMQMVRKYCSADVFDDCGMSYRIASKYLDEVGQIYERYCHDDILRRLELIKTRQALELTCAYDAAKLKRFIDKSEKLLDEYREHAAQDADKHIFDLYVVDIRNNTGTAYYRLGCVYLEKNMVKDAVMAYEQAVGFYTECIEVYRVTNEQGSDLLLMIYLNIANTKLRLYRCQKDDKYLNDSIMLMQESIRKFKKLFPDSIPVALAYCTLGTTYRLKGEFKSSIRYYRIAEKLGDRIIKQGDCAEVFFWIYEGYADAYKNMGFISKAVEYLNKQRELLLRCGYEADSTEVSEIDERLKELG